MPKKKQPLRNFLFIANTRSGTMDCKELKKILTKHFTKSEADFSILELKRGDKHMEGHIERAIEKHQPDCVVACGGDGTVATVGHAIRELHLPLGIIPLGTANIFAQCMGIPIKTEKALELLLAPTPKIRILDAMECKNRFYFLQITIGISSLITYRTPQDEKRRFGIFAYTRRLFSYLNRFHRRFFTFTVDGKKYKRRVTEAVMANTDMFFSRPFRLGENIEMDDGCLDLLAFSPRNWLDHFKFISYFTFGRPHMNSQVFFRRRFHHLHIETAKPMWVHADGEIIGQTPVEITLRPQALQVIAGN